MSNLDILPRRGEVMWYVIQTTTGREEELTDVLKSMLKKLFHPAGDLLEAKRKT